MTFWILLGAAVAALLVLGLVRDRARRSARKPISQDHSDARHNEARAQAHRNTLPAIPPG